MRGKRKDRFDAARRRLVKSRRSVGEKASNVPSKQRSRQVFTAPPSFLSRRQPLSFFRLYRRFRVVFVRCKRKSSLFFEAEAKRPSRVAVSASFLEKPQKISAFPGGDFGGPDFPPSPILESVPTSRFAKRRRFAVASATSGSVRVVAPLRRLGVLRRVEKFWVLGDAK